MLSFFGRELSTGEIINDREHVVMMVKGFHKALKRTFFRG